MLTTPGRWARSRSCREASPSSSTPLRIPDGGAEHTIEAQGGNWTTGGIEPGLFEYVALSTPLRIPDGGAEHTIEAQGGNWTTGGIEPGLFEYVAFDAPGVSGSLC